MRFYRDFLKRNGQFLHYLAVGPLNGSGILSAGYVPGPSRASQMRIHVALNWRGCAPFDRRRVRCTMEEMWRVRHTQ
jgi:hypothetical protein